MFGPSLAGFIGGGLRVDYLLVAGGNGGQNGMINLTDAGSGSGGNVLSGSIRLRSGTYAITVGTGGLAGNGSAAQGAQGGIGTHSAIAGVADTAFLNGVAVQNGLGGGYNLSGASSFGWGGQRGSAPGGFNGGAPGGGPSFTGAAGKAGGAGAGAGGSATGPTPGAGIISAISGAAVEYGRGGVTGNNVAPTIPGTGGFGGSSAGNAASGSDGAPGIVIVRYPLSIASRASGGQATALGGYTILTFFANGTLTVF